MQPCFLAWESILDKGLCGQQQGWELAVGRDVPVLQQPHTTSVWGRTHLQVPVYQLVGLKVIVIFSKRVNDLLCNLEREGAR